MADLGQLEQYLDDDAVSFQIGRKRYTIKPTALDVLRFQQNFNTYVESNLSLNSIEVVKLAAPFFGSTLNEETFTIEGGILEELIEKGVSWSVIDRLTSSVFVKFRFNDADLARELFTNGTLGKAKKVVAESDSQETPKEHGETTSDDFETVTD